MLDPEVVSACRVRRIELYDGVCSAQKAVCSLMRMGETLRMRVHFKVNLTVVTKSKVSKSHVGGAGRPTWQLMEGQVSYLARGGPPQAEPGVQS